MTEKRVNDSTEATYQYNQMNQLVSKMENGIASSYQYDKRGNQTEEKSGNKIIRQYDYDATNHMVLGRNAETGEKSEYTYNSLYLRVKNVQTLEQHRNSYESYDSGAGDEDQRSAFRAKETDYVIDYLSDTNNELMSTETGYGATRVTYGRGSERLSQKVSIFPETPKTIQTDLAQENSGKTYFQSDRLGSVLFASNQKGEVLRYAPRDAWGNLQVPVEDDINCAGLENSLGFTNHTYDPVLDKYFAQARFYDGENARMISKDTYWNPQNNIYGDDAADNLLPDTNTIRQSMNRYTYALNNPIRYHDPSGYLAVCQYGSFAWEFANEAVNITLNNTMGSLPRCISIAKEFVASMNEFLQEKPSVEDIINAMGQGVWDGLSGDLRFVFNHLDWYKMNKKLTTKQVEELAQRSARAYEEGAQIIMTVVMAVKALKGKIKVAKEQKGGKSTKKYVTKRGPNVKKATKGGSKSKQIKTNLQFFAEEGGSGTKSTGQITTGKNFKDHFIRHKHLLEKVTGNKYPSYKEPQAFLDDIAKLINNGDVKLVGQGTLNKTSGVMNIYRGQGITIVTKLNGVWVTILEQGKAMDLNIKFIK